MTTYTVRRKDGAVIACGLTLEEAAREVLSYDSYEYEVRPVTTRVEIGTDADDEPIYEDRQRLVKIGPPDDPNEPTFWAWQCYSSEMSSAGHGGPGAMTPIPDTYCLARTAEEAWTEIAKIVVDKCGAWPGSPDVETDAEYDAVLARIAAEEDAA